MCTRRFCTVHWYHSSSAGGGTGIRSDWFGSDQLGSLAKADATKVGQLTEMLIVKWNERTQLRTGFAYKIRHHKLSGKHSRFPLWLCWLATSIAWQFSYYCLIVLINRILSDMQSCRAAELGYASPSLELMNPKPGRESRVFHQAQFEMQFPTSFQPPNSKLLCRFMAKTWF